MQSHSMLELFNALTSAPVWNEKTLLKSFKDLNFQDNNGDTFLHLALKNHPGNFIGILKCLFRNGADPHLLNNNGESFFDVLCSSKDIEPVTKFFIFEQAKSYIDPFLIKEENKIFLPYVNYNSLQLVRHPLIHKQHNRMLSRMIYDFSIPRTVGDNSTAITQESLFSEIISISRYGWRIKIRNVSRLFIEKYIEFLLKKNDVKNLINIFYEYKRDPTFIFLDVNIKTRIVNCIINDESGILSRRQQAEFIYKLYQLDFPIPPDFVEIVSQVERDMDSSLILKELCNHNDFTGLESYLNDNPNLNINIKFPDGRTLLDYAYTQKEFAKQQIMQTVKKSITDTVKIKRIEAGKADADEQKVAIETQKNAEKFFQLVLKKSNIHTPLTNNQTFLHLVAFNEDKPPLIEIVHYLLRGADPNAKDNYNNTALSYLTKKKEKDFKLSNSFDTPDMTLEKFSHDLNNHILLLTNGIEYYLSDDKKTQTLYDMLVDDIKRSSDSNKDDETLRKEVIEFLEPLIADFPTMPDSHGKTHLHRAIEKEDYTRSLELIETEFKPSIIDIQDNNGNTALHVAIKKNKINEHIIKALLVKGANFNILNEQKESPLHLACAPYLKDILHEIVKLHDANLKDEAINLIFKAAFLADDAEMIGILVDKHLSKIKLDKEIIKTKKLSYQRSADILCILVKHNIINIEQLKQDDNILLNALDSNYANLISILMDEELANKYLNLMLASNEEEEKKEIVWLNNKEIAWRPKPEILEILLKKAKSFDISMENKRGDTLLHRCVNLQNSELEILLNKGADPNKKNNKGFSPLHTAVQKLKPMHVKELLLHGADPLIDSTDRFARFIPFWRNTPLDYAKGLFSDYNGLPPDQNCYGPLKDLFNTYPGGKHRPIFGRIMYFFSGFFPYLNYSKKHLHYLLNNGISIEELPYTLKKPYPGLLKAFIEYTIDEKRPDVLNTILIRYSNEQLNILKTDKTLAQKVISCLNIKENAIAPTTKINILKKLKVLSSPSDIKKITDTEKSIKTEENIFNDLALRGKPAFFEKRMLYFQMLKAINDNNFAAVKELFYKNPSYNFNIKDQEGRTLLDIVYTRNRKYEMGLEEKTVSQELKSPEEYTASKDIFMLLLGKLNINDRTQNNKTLLHLATESDENNAPMEDILMFLLLGANVNLKDAMGNPPHKYAVNSSGHLRKNLQSPENFSLLGIGLSAFSPDSNWLFSLAKSIGADKLRQLSTFASLPESNKLMVDHLLKRIEKEQQPTLNPQR